ncbi:MAG: pilus assembly PilX N-terminal domain-containing protein [Acidobacteriota bacterium]
MRRTTRAVTSYREGERGSVFVVALMVLVMLTVIGLSLALVTETEMLIGGNEQVISETQVVAEMAPATSISQLMVANATDSKCLGLVASEQDGSDRQVGLQTLGYSVDTTHLYPLAFNVAPYSKANAGREDTLYAGFFRGGGRAIRGAWQQTPARQVPREQGEELDDISDLFTTQAEEEVEIAFYSAPLQALESATLIDAFDHPEVLGCEPHPPHLDLIAPPPP